MDKRVDRMSYKRLECFYNITYDITLKRLSLNEVFRFLNYFRVSTKLFRVKKSYHP